MASRFILRSRPLLHLFRRQHKPLQASFFEPTFFSYTSVAAERRSRRRDAPKSTKNFGAITSLKSPRVDDPETREWRKVEAEIWNDIGEVVDLMKEILHGDRHTCGERLSNKDEKLVVEKLLNYHPNREEKIGSGIDFIMVDEHPEFEGTKCLFVVRKDGGWSDFSYRKSIRAYIRQKFPSHAERFIQARIS